MLKSQITLFILLANFQLSIGQSAENTCILEQPAPCELECDIISYNDSVHYVFRIIESGHSHPVTFNASVKTFEIHREETIRYSIYDYLMTPYGVVATALDLSNVTYLGINVHSNIIDSASNFSISEMPSLEYLLLPNLKSIHVSLTGYLGYKAPYLNVELSKWKNYDYLVERNTLESFSISIDDNYYDIDKGIDTSTISALFKFKNLELLAIPMYLNKELIHFQNLEYLNAFEIEYLFAQNAAQLSGLGQYRFYERTITENYAQRTFFMNNLHCFPDTLDLERIAVYNQPYYNQDALKNKIQESKGSGHFTMLVSDLFSYPPYKGFNAKMTDTLWDGELKNGKMVGLWKINLDHAKNKIYFINFDRIGFDTLPENGYFEYYFANGQLGIEGEMKDGNKEGTWKFYNLQGKLVSVKNYVHDRPRGFFIDYENTFEPYYGITVIRRFYVSDLEYYEIHEKDFCDFPRMFFERSDGSYGIYYDIETKQLTVYESGKITSTYSFGDKGFSTAMFEGFFQYLYPDTKMKDIPYFECYFKTRKKELH